jgi:regulator of protease activity HflC (stomatin/prohibitin superfamily)
MKQAAILEAEGRREAAFRDAEAREREAEAEAKATSSVSEAIASGNISAINYFLGLKYVEAFQALAVGPNQKFVILPMESAGILGSLAGIAELARQGVGLDGSGKPPQKPASPTVPQTPAQFYPT